MPGTQQTHAAVLTLTAIFVFPEWVRNSRGCPRVCLTLGKHRNVSLMELLHGCASAICAAESVITGGGGGETVGCAGTRRPLGAAGHPVAAAPVCFSLLKIPTFLSFAVSSVYPADD